MSSVPWNLLYVTLVPSVACGSNPSRLSSFVFLLLLLNIPLSTLHSYLIFRKSETSTSTSGGTKVVQPPSNSWVRNEKPVDDGQAPAPAPTPLALPVLTCYLFFACTYRFLFFESSLNELTYMPLSTLSRKHTGERRRGTGRGSTNTGGCTSPPG